MMPVNAIQARVLGFHPTARGFGWVVFEGPFRPIDWGLVSARKDKNATCLKRLKRLHTRFAPETLVLEAYDRETPDGRAVSLDLASGRVPWRTGRG